MSVHAVYAKRICLLGTAFILRVRNAMPCVWYNLIAMLVICVCMRCIDNQILSLDVITFRHVAVEEAWLSSHCLDNFGAAHHVTCSFILAKSCAEMLLSKVLLARYRRLDTCGYHLVAHTTLYKQRSRSISNHRLPFWWLWPNVERRHHIHQSIKTTKCFQ